MKDQDILNLWKSYDKKLEETLVLSRQNAEYITGMKVKSFITSMKPIKLIVIVAGILWVAAGTMIIGNLLLSAFHTMSKYFLFSAILQLLLTFLAIVIYLYQLVVMHRINISDSVIKTQEKLAQLRSSTLWVARILFLQLPLWTTFYWSNAMWKHATVWAYLIQGTVTGVFLFTAIWLFLNINYKNKDKKWFRFIFRGKEWDSVLKSMELLQQISDYRK